MNRILFYTENYSSKSVAGGTEVATYRIASALKNTGEFEVYHAFRKKYIKEDNGVYSGIIQLKGSISSFIKEMSDFIRRHEIDVVVNMTRFFRQRMIVKAVEKSGRKVKIIFMQHFAPGSEFKKTTWQAGLHLLKLNPSNPLYWLRSTFYPLIKLPRNHKLPRMYKYAYDTSDRVVLLSDAYKKEYMKVAKTVDDKKFVAIPNIFDGSPATLEKKKRVLILSRLDEIQKRLSLALKVWERIENDPDLSEWQLDIVGNGHNRDIVKRLIKKLRLQNVHLHGWQNPIPFLQQDSILMLTSAYEGLPLTILEAQTCGCVPIAFNSFGALEDVVERYENGVIVDNFDDIDDYVKKLTELMYDTEYRQSLMKNAMISADKFSSEKIAGEWLRILT